MNKVTLIGRPAKVEKKTNCVTFSLATDEKSAKNKEDNTSWHHCVACGKTAEIIENWLPKVKLAYVEGKLNYSKYNNVTYTSIFVDKIEFLAYKDKDKIEASTASEPSEPINHTFDDDDIPF